MVVASINNINSLIFCVNNFLVIFLIVSGGGGGGGSSSNNKVESNPFSYFQLLLLYWQQLPFLLLVPNTVLQKLFYSVRCLDCGHVEG
jgi:hypothetical protein